MTSNGNDHSDDEEFAAFLQGEGALARRLRDLRQPEPSAALDAAILAQVKADLACGDMRLPEIANDAANDASMPGSAGRARPRFQSRWRMPLAMAASLVCALFLLLQWQKLQQSPAPLVVAQAPQAALPEVRGETPERTIRTTPPSSSAGQPAAPMVAVNPPAVAARKVMPAPAASAAQRIAAPDTDVDADRREAVPAIQIAQADTSELSPKSLAPAPAATAPMPPPAAARAEAAPAAVARAPMPISTADAEKAKAWLALIEEMLKADLRQDALAEWEKFRKVYPQYPVPARLEARINALKK